MGTVQADIFDVGTAIAIKKMIATQKWVIQDGGSAASKIK
jgi:hypothetical protein